MKIFRNAWIALAVAWCLILSVRAAEGQEDTAAEAKVAVHRAAAAKSLVAYARSDVPYDVTVDDLLSIIRKDLAGHQQAAEDKLTAATTDDPPLPLELLAGERVETRIEQICADFGPAGTEDLKTWLTGFYQRINGGQESLQDQVRQEVRRRFADPADAVHSRYVQARNRVAAEQVKPACRGLLDKPDAYFLVDEKRIREAAASTDAARKAADEVESALRLKIPSGELLLAEADALLAKLAAAVVDCAVTQFHAQQALLERQPNACTLSGIEAELLARLQNFVEEKRTRQTSLPPLSGDLPPIPERTYGAFFTAEEVRKQATVAFDRGIAAEIEKLIADPSLPPDFQDRVASAIQEDIAGHFEESDTRAHFGLTNNSDNPLQESNAAVKHGLDSLVKALERLVAERESPHDSPEALARLRDDIRERVRVEDAASGPSVQTGWSRLADKVTVAMMSVIRTTRRDIAEQQAKGCPALMTNNWTPTEKMILDEHQVVNADTLRAEASLWAGKTAPQKEEVLAETWTTWETRMKLILTVGQRALRGQLRLVEETRAEMLQRIELARKTTPEPSDSEETWLEWRDQYTRYVESLWKKKVEAQDFPDLFLTTKENIDGALAKVVLLVQQMDVVNRLRSAMEKTVSDYEGGAGMPSREELEHQYTGEAEARWKSQPGSKQHPDIEPQVREKIGDLVDEILQTRLSTLVKEQQEQIVDAKRPDVKKLIDADARVKSDPGRCRGEYAEQYQNVVLDEWTASAKPYARKAYPELLRSTKQIIQQNVNEMIPAVEVAIVPRDRPGGPGEGTKTDETKEKTTDPPEKEQKTPEPSSPPNDKEKNKHSSPEDEKFGFSIPSWLIPAIIVAVVLVVAVIAIVLLTWLILTLRRRRRAGNLVVALLERLGPLESQVLLLQLLVAIVERYGSTAEVRLRALRDDAAQNTVPMR